MFESMQSSEPEVIIHMEDVSLCYEISSEPIQSLKEYAIRLLQGKIKKRKILALSNIDLDIYRDEILGFAEIGDFTDAPIRTYSSGMIARLGFAVATAWRPEILILDEVFAVGDIFLEKNGQK